MTDQQWDKVIAVNLTGIFNVTRHVSAATKAGVIGLTYTWAKEFSRKGAAVRTNAIAMGDINKEMMQTVPEIILNSMKDNTPLKRLSEPIEISNAALFLASDEASFVNG